MIKRMIVVSLLSLYSIEAQAQVSSGWAPNLQFAQTLTGTGTVQITTNGAATALVVATGSGSGMTFSFQGTSDNGTTWTTLPGAVPSSGSVATSFSANGAWQVPVAGFTSMRVNVTGFSSGSETFTLSSTPETNVIATTTSGGGGGGGGSVNVIATSSATGAITPCVAGSSASSCILKASSGNLYSVYATAGATAGYLMVFNSATLPANGSTTAGTASGNLVECANVAANSTTSISFNPGPPELYSTGITAAFSSTGCATLTASATAFIKGSAQ